MKIYDSEREQEEISFIKTAFSKGFRIINPNTDIEKKNKEKPSSEIMKLCLKAVKKARIVICSEYHDHIGKGIYQELELVLEKKIPVFCIVKKDSEYGLKKVVSLEIDNEKDWSVSYGKLIFKD